MGHVRRCVGSMMRWLRVAAVVFLALIGGAGPVTLLSPAVAVLKGSASPAITRILLVGYGQSNMDQLFSVSDSPPPAAANTFYYDTRQTPAVITSVPAADGIRILQNTVTGLTGLPTLSIRAAVGGSSIAGLSSGGPNTFQTGYQGLINQVLANIQPTDQVFFLWDHGESDSVGSTFPDVYAAKVVALFADLAVQIGRTPATAPLIICGKGTVLTAASVGLVGVPFFGPDASIPSWSWIINDLKAVTDFVPSARWFSAYDFERGTDGLHYIATNGTALGGARFARLITNFMGYTSGAPVFEIASAAVVDATHTDVTFTHSLGTDFTPTSSADGTNGFEVSGDNGKTWSTVSTSRISASVIRLAHGSLTTTNSRLVRHCYGSSPPDTDPVNVSQHPPSKLTRDNSALTIPLSPTPYTGIRATGLTTLPMVTWRDVTSLSGNGGQVQTATKQRLGPEHVRKYLVLSIACSSVGILDMTITPKDFLGNAVGTPIVLTSPSPLASSGSIAIYGTALNSDNANASTFDLRINYNGSPFHGTIVQTWTIPYADLNSTTKTGSNGSTTSSSTTGTTTLTASAGGLIIAAAFSDTTQTSSTSYGFTGTDSGAHDIPTGLRWLVYQSIPSMGGDGANIQSAGTASVTANFVSSGTVDVAAVAFR